MKKRLLSLCLSFCLAMSLLPITAFAAGYSGSCGKNVTWRFEPDTGALYLEGSGPTTSYKGVNPEQKIGWYNYRSKIKAIYVGEGITSLGDSYCKKCPSLSYIKLPSTLKDIDSFGVFSYCDNLKGIELPEGLETIGAWAFLNTEMETITVPSTVTKISGEAFGSNTNIRFLGNAPELSYLTRGGGMINNSYPFKNSSDVTVYYPSNASGWDTVSALPYFDKVNFVAFDPGTWTPEEPTQPATKPGWSSTVDPYNLGDETYSFSNYGDSDSAGGHCFGMSITSAGYHNNLLDIGGVGGNANTPLYSFSETQTVKRPICHYQGIQGSYSSDAIVAGGSFYLNQEYDIASDWREVVNYVRDHSYDDTGLLQIGFRKSDQGGHAINFLRYENVNGQDRIYAYDNNFPTQETYFYRDDSSESVWQAPVQTFSGAIDCIALRDCRTYFNSVGDFDATHVLYMVKDAASVEGEYPYSYMEAAFSDEEYVMYEIPASVEQVIIIPHSDNASFIYMDEAYSFGKVTDETRGELKLASEGSAGTGASFRTYEEEDPVPSVPSFADVPAGSWYYDAVQWAVEQGITNGTGVNPATFSPMRSCKQVEILAFLWRANGEPSSSAHLPFAPENSWAEDALRWGMEQGMIDASFDENAPCTRATAVRFMWQAAGSPYAAGSGFSDVPASAGYAAAVNWAVSEGITNGTGTNPPTFSPNKTCNRAEIVTLLYRDR